MMSDACAEKSPHTPPNRSKVSRGCERTFDHLNTTHVVCLWVIVSFRRGVLNDDGCGRQGRGNPNHEKCLKSL